MALACLWAHAVTVSAGQQADRAAKPDYSRENTVTEQFTREVTFQADGTWQAETTTAVRVQSETALRALGVLSVMYRADNQKIELSYVRVKKTDGTTVETAPDGAQDATPGATRSAPTYSDLREKQLPVKGLAIGDLLEYKVKTSQFRPEIPGQFWFAANFARGEVALAETLRISVPADKYVKVESPLYKPEVSEANGRKVYLWKTQQTEPTKTVIPHAAPAHVAGVPVATQQPSVQVTTFRNWEEVGQWFAGLEATQMTVTPALQAKADELTKGLTSNDAKEHALYEYVSEQFRYISISLGVGRYQPHSANEVLSNAYGDCKDKHTLFAALLKAEGIQAWPALIGMGMKLDENMPSPAQFNHLITLIPNGKEGTWLDTTAEVAPFGLLIADLRDKKALVVREGGAATLDTTPPNPPFASFYQVDVDTTFKSDGMLSAHCVLRAHGDAELLWRRAFRQVPQGEWGTLLEQAGKATGIDRKISNVTLEGQKLAGPLHFSYDSEEAKYPGWDSGHVPAPLPPMIMQPAAGSPAPAEALFLGALGEIEYRATVHFPKGFATSVPKGVDVHYTFADYRSTYTVESDVAHIERRLTIKQSKIPRSGWDGYVQFAGIVAADEKTTIPPQNASQSAAVGHDEAEAERLLKAAEEAHQSQDYGVEGNYLKKVESINPQQPHLWSDYGMLHLSLQEPQKAIAALEREIQLHPDDPAAYRALARGQEGTGKPEEAASTFKTLLKKMPDDTEGLGMYAVLLNKTRQYSEVPPLVEPMLAKKENHRLQFVLAEAYLRSGQKEKGIANAKEAVKEGNSLAFNRVAFLLADTSVDLALAKEYASQALLKGESETSGLTLETVNNEDIRKVTNLGFIWDTMGWVLFQAGDFAGAEKFIEASWNLNQRAPVGDHLGQVYAKLGKTKEAIRTWQISIDAPGEHTQAVNHLRAVGAPFTFEQPIGKSNLQSSQPLYPAEALSQMRMIRLPELPKETGPAQVLLLISKAGVEDVSFISGSEGAKPTAAALKQAHYGITFPDAGGEKVVRKGVLSCSYVTKPACEIVLIPMDATRR